MEQLAQNLNHSGAGSVSAAGAWARGARQVCCDLRLWVALMVMFTAYRGILLVWFRESLDAGWNARDLGLCFGRGFFFDVRMATLMIMPSLAAGLALALARRERWAATLRRCWVWALVTVSVTLAIVNMGFFSEYHEQFNQWIFGMIYDDRAAIVKTVWKDYPVGWIGLGWLALTVSLGLALARFTAHGGRCAALMVSVRRWHWRAVCALALTVGVVFGFRGSLGRRPMQKKDMAVTRIQLFNAVVPNFYTTLRYAVADHNRQTNPRRLPDWLSNSGGIRGALEILFGEPARDAADLDTLLVKTASGNANGQRPRHIFFIVMESGDLWPMLPPYAELGLMPETRRLADSGVFFSRFISAGEGTMTSLSAIITGIPHTGALQNYQPLSRRPFPTALPLAFKRLGYKTKLYYGGFLSWQRLGAFAADQGFDEIHGGGDMALSDSDLGEWGVPDGALFDYVAARTDADLQPTFNLILTTSYHPPYPLDVRKLGCAIEYTPPSLSGVYDGRVPLREFAHLRYADRELGRFVARVEQQHPASLFAITGDHWSRRFLNQHPTLYESRAVPLVLHGPLTLGGATGERLTPGSHLDIAPTLVNLAAERGFVYHTFGNDLLSPSARPYAQGRDVLMTATDIMLFPSADADPYTRQVSAWLGAAWWRLLRGSELETPALLRNSANE